jgi:hypothetical protein
MTSESELNLSLAAVAVVNGAEAGQRRSTSAMALTPDAVLHSPPLAASDSAADAGLAEGLAALESYKKKDSAKG